jgi:hypothetical protein
MTPIESPGPPSLSDGFLRRPSHRYADPLDRVWIGSAEAVGFRIGRTPAAYATSDGRGTILLGTADQFDPDDSLAQMILHELCHALVEGEAGEGRADWGLDNTRQGHPWREHACLRLQVYLADSVGLRRFFAPTTDYRVTFWDALPADPFAAPESEGGRRERSCVAARVAAWRASLPRWAPLRAALEASAAIAAQVPRSLRDEAAPSLWAEIEALPAPHPAGHAPVAAYHAGSGCADCAWGFRARGSLRCRHAPKVRLADAAPACARFEPAAELDCQACGACCREAYHSVELSRREPLVKRRPEWVVDAGTHVKLRRDGERCVALVGGRSPGELYACAAYGERPRTCREFERGGGHCLDARRRVGLSL